MTPKRLKPLFIGLRDGEKRFNVQRSTVVNTFYSITYLQAVLDGPTAIAICRLVQKWYRPEVDPGSNRLVNADPHFCDQGQYDLDNTDGKQGHITLDLAVLLYFGSCGATSIYM